jgi:hypothetical protein
VQRLSDGFAHVARVGHCQLICVLVHEVGESVQDRLPLLESHPRPRPLIEGLASSRNGAVGIRLAAACDGGPRLTREGIDVVHRRPVEGRHFLAVDDVAVELHLVPFDSAVRHDR